MTPFYDQYNMINSRPDEKCGENAVLYTVQHFFLLKKDSDRLNIKKAINGARTAPGIFSDHPHHVKTHHWVHTSHDQLTAFSAFSACNSGNVAKEIWEEVKRQWFRYNNVEIPTTWKEKLLNKRFLHPRDIIFFGYCAGSKICTLLLPLLWIIMFLSTFSKKQKNGVLATDGKLLNFVRLSALKNKSWMWKVQWKLHNYIIEKRFGSWNEIFKVFFPYKKHPNVIASKDI